MRIWGLAIAVSLAPVLCHNAVSLDRGALYRLREDVGALMQEADPDNRGRKD